jgi:hypothetical protein
MDENKFGPKLNPAQRAELVEKVRGGMSIHAAARESGIRYGSARWLVDRVAWGHVLRLLGWDPDMSSEQVLRRAAAELENQSNHSGSPVTASDDPIEDGWLPRMRTRVATLERDLATMRRQLGLRTDGGSPPVG